MILRKSCKTLNFTNYIKEKITKANIGIGILRILYGVLPKSSSITVYKSLIWPHLDFGVIIFDQPKNESFCENIESVQFTAALAITGAIQELFLLIGVHSMQSWTANTRHGVTRKRSTKILKHTENLFRKNLQLKDVC